MKTNIKTISPLLKTVLILALAFCVGFNSMPIPDTSIYEPEGIFPASIIPASTSTIPTLADFTKQVTNGVASQVTGIFAEGAFAYPVVQQPSGKAAYVSTTPNVVTQFGSAASYGSLGFLAHNYLAGSTFTKVARNTIVYIIYGDGHQSPYIVDQIRRFQALSPYNPYSNFKDLEQGKTLTASQLFYQTYGVSKQVILQTCISSNGIDSWGRLFIIAKPYTPLQSGSLSQVPQNPLAR